jgi:phage terminase large subunit GpA-like protein
MPSGESIKLKQFSMPRCNKCGEKAILTIKESWGTFDGYCDPELEPTLVVCNHCEIIEEITLY